MKKIETFLIFAFMLVLASESYSQTFGVRAGLNLANMYLKDAYVKYDTKMITGFNLGATAEFPVAKMLSFETGLFLSTKGAKVSYEREPNAKYNFTYLDVPLNAKVSFVAVDGVKLSGIIGPYISMGLGGKYYTGGDFNVGETLNIQWGTKEWSYEYIKQLDYGLNIGIGAEIKQIEVRLNYGLGLANICGFDDGTKINNRTLGLSVGYRFGKM